MHTEQFICETQYSLTHPTTTPMHVHAWIGTSTKRAQISNMTLYNNII